MKLLTGATDRCRLPIVPARAAARHAPWPAMSPCSTGTTGWAARDAGRRRAARHRLACLRRDRRRWDWIRQPPNGGVLRHRGLRPVVHLGPCAVGYSSWRRHQRPVSLRPRGARSSHWYMPQRPSRPARVRRVGVVDDAVLEHERAHARPLARYVAASVPRHGRESSRRPPSCRRRPVRRR